MRSSRRRRGTSQRVGDLFFDDIWRKLSALAIAGLLWVWLDQRETDSIALSYNVTFTGLEAADEPLADGMLRVLYDRDNISLVDTTEGTPAVTVEFIGRKYDLPSLDSPPPLQAIASFRDEVEGKVTALIPSPALRSFDANAVASSVRIRWSGAQLSLTGVPRSSRLVLLTASHVPRQGLIDSGLPVDEFDLTAAEFSPPSIKVAGPTRRIREIWDGLGFLTPASRIDTGTRRDASVEILLRPKESGVSLGEPVLLKLPRIDRGSEILLPGVPVVLHEPETLRGRFVPRRRQIDVPVRAFGLLARQLTALSAEDLQKWVTENALLVARVPPDASGPDVITGPQLLLDSEYRGGRDFEMTTPLTIDFRPKNP